MSNKLDCEIVRDLLPPYLEGLTSEVTNRAVKKHLTNCIECMRYYKEMDSDINMLLEEDEEVVRKAFIKAKRMYIINGVFWTLCILSILIPIIIDFSINRCLSWSYIVLGGCIIGYSLLRIILFGSENKIKNIISVISLTIIPYIYVIQCVLNNYFMEQPIYWFKLMAAPITLTWILMIWINYFVWVKLKKNIYYKLSLCSITVIIGSIFTDIVIFLNGFFMNENIKINYLVYLLIFIVFLIMGRNKEKRCN